MHINSQINSILSVWNENMSDGERSEMKRALSVSDTSMVGLFRERTRNRQQFTNINMYFDND